MTGCEHDWQSVEVLAENESGEEIVQYKCGKCMKTKTVKK